MKQVKEKMLNIGSVRKFINSYEVEAKCSFKKETIKLPINSKSRLKPFIYHRNIIYDFLYKNGLSNQRIADLFDMALIGGTNHATVMNGRQKYEWEKHTPEYRMIKRELDPHLETLFDIRVVEQSLTAEELGFNTTEIAIMNCETVYDLVSFKAKLVEQLSLAQINGKR